MKDKVSISAAQMTALETAGVFEADDTDGLDLLRASIDAGKIAVSFDVAARLCELANIADVLGNDRTRDRDDAAMYRADCRALTALQCKVSKAALALLPKPTRRVDGSIEEYVS